MRRSIFLFLAATFLGTVVLVAQKAETKNKVLLDIRKEYRMQNTEDRRRGLLDTVRLFCLY